MTPQSAPASSANSISPLAFAFDVGHSSIGWSVLTPPEGARPEILGCGVVLFEKDSALANQRRLHRQQRRHVRATRQRIARLEKLLVHLGAFTANELATKHRAAAGHGAPWLLAARVLASAGARTLTWSELWDVLRWYAHNRGYESIGDDPDEKENAEKRSAAREGMARTGKHSMAETICAWLHLDPLGETHASTESYKTKNAAFDRDVVRSEVGSILTAHRGRLTGVDDTFIRAVLDDARAIEVAAIKLPLRYKGGLLFGRLQMRYHNRIIGRCPFLAEELARKLITEGLSESEAQDRAFKQAKLPSKDCPEYLRFRWAMLLANILVSTEDRGDLRRLSVEERKRLTELARQEGYFTPGAFRRKVRELVGSRRDNLEQMFMDATAEENLVLDPALRLARSKEFLKDAWPHLPENVRNHALTRWRRGRAQTLASLREQAAHAAHDLAPFDAAIATACASPRKKSKKSVDTPPPTVAEILATKFAASRLGGRAPYSREFLRRAHDEAMTGKHPREEGGCLFETPQLRRLRETRTLDQQTNNHLVRHRLQILGRLIDHLVADPAFGSGEPGRVKRITLEVNRELREWAGKSAQEIVKEMNERLRSHGKVSKRLVEELPAGTKINASLIRKARIADDLDWHCPYTGHEFEPIDLVTRRVDLDHIVPRSQRRSDSLDSLVVTFAEINKWKDNRTAWQFMEQEQAKPVPGMANLSLKQLNRYKSDVEALDKRGHPDDQKRKKRRIEKLLLEHFEEKSGGFTPGQLTQTSHLSRLGQQVLQRPFAQSTEPPVFTALPGQITARVRAAWNLLGCLAAAAPGVLETRTDADGREHRVVKTKTEIRDITHLHHALDACVIGLAAEKLRGNRGDVWSALLERRPDAQQRALLTALDLGDFDASGGFRLRDLPESMKDQIRTRLAERRVVQHVPADMSGIRVEENTRGIVKREGGRVYLQQRKRNAEGRRVTNLTDEIETKVIGLPVLGPTGGKLAKLNGVRVIADNFGVAILDDTTLPPAERFVIIPFARVWEQLNELKLRNGGRKPKILRIGKVVVVPKGNYAGTWTVRGVQLNKRAGLLVDLSFPDVLVYRTPGRTDAKQNVSLATLVRDGLAIKSVCLIGSSI